MYCDMCEAEKIDFCICDKETKQDKQEITVPKSGLCDYCNKKEPVSTLRFKPISSTMLRENN